MDGCLTNAEASLALMKLAMEDMKNDPRRLQGTPEYDMDVYLAYESLKSAVLKMQHVISVMHTKGYGMVIK